MLQQPFDAAAYVVPLLLQVADLALQAARHFRRGLPVAAPARSCGAEGLRFSLLPRRVPHARPSATPLRAERALREPENPLLPGFRRPDPSCPLLPLPYNLTAFLGELSCALPERSISPNANEGRQIRFTPVHMCARIDTACDLCAQLAAERFERADDAVRPCVQLLIAQGALGDWKVVETSIE